MGRRAHRADARGRRWVGPGPAVGRTAHLAAGPGGSGCCGARSIKRTRGYWMTTTPPVTLLQDPTSQRTVHVRPRAPRMTGLSGRRIALLDISQPRGDVFHDRLEELLTERGAVVSRFRKPTLTQT